MTEKCVVVVMNVPSNEEGGIPEGELIKMITDNTSDDGQFIIASFDDQPEMGTLVGRLLNDNPLHLDSVLHYVKKVEEDLESDNPSPDFAELQNADFETRVSMERDAMRAKTQEVLNKIVKDLKLGKSAEEDPTFEDPILNLAVSVLNTLKEDVDLKLNPGEDEYNLEQLTDVIVNQVLKDIDDDDDDDDDDKETLCESSMEIENAFNLLLNALVDQIGLVVNMGSLDIRENDLAGNLRKLAGAIEDYVTLIHNAH